MERIDCSELPDEIISDLFNFLRENMNLDLQKTINYNHNKQEITLYGDEPPTKEMMKLKIDEYLFTIIQEEKYSAETRLNVTEYLDQNPS